MFLRQINFFACTGLYVMKCMSSIMRYYIQFYFRKKNQSVYCSRRSWVFGKKYIIHDICHGTRGND